MESRDEPPAEDTGNLFAELTTIIRSLANAPTWDQVRELLYQNPAILHVETRPYLVRICSYLQDITSTADDDAATQLLEEFSLGMHILDRAPYVILHQQPSPYMEKLLDLVHQSDVSARSIPLKVTELVEQEGLAASVEARRIYDELSPNNNRTIMGRLSDIVGLIEARQSESTDAPSDPNLFEFAIRLPSTMLPPRLLRKIDSLESDVEFAEYALAFVQSADGQELADADRGDVFFNLGNLSFQLARRTGQRKYYDNSIQCFREAVPQHDQSWFTYGAVASNLANALMARYTTFGDTNDVNEALGYTSSALNGIKLDSAEHLNLLQAHAAALRCVYGATGDTNRLVEARDAMAQAAGVAQRAFPHEEARVLQNFGSNLQDSFVATGTRSLLRAAVDCHRRSLALTPRSDDSWALRASSLGNVLRASYESSQSQQDLSESIQVLRDLLREAPDDVDLLVKAMNNYALSLRARFVIDRNQADIDTAIETLTSVLERESKSSPTWTNHVGNLAICLSDRARVDGSLTDIDRAIELYKSTEEESIVGIGTFSDLGRAGNMAELYKLRHQGRGSTSDLDEAVRLYRRIGQATTTKHANKVGWESIQVWAEWATERNSWDESAEAYSYLLILMNDVYRAQHSRAEKESTMRELQFVAADMAFSFLRVGNLERAAVALEEARCIWLSELLERKSALSEQQAGLDTETAQVWTELLQSIETLETLVESGAEVSLDLTLQLETAKRDRILLEEQIRETPGFEDFMQPISFSSISRKATPGRQIVYIAFARTAGFAIIVGNDTTYSVEFPDYGLEVFFKRVSAYLAAESQQVVRRAEYLQSMYDLMTWLYEEFASKIDAACEARGLVIVPTGPAALVPWHAAMGAGPELGSVAMPWISSREITYASSAKSLIDGASADPESVLGISADATDLPWSTVEIRAATATASSRLIDGPERTQENVLKAIARYPTVHFACHGILNLADPIQSALQLGAAERITVADLMNSNVTADKLFILSACDSAFAGVGTAMEAVTFPTVLLAGGAHGVIGTLWPVGDFSSCVLIGRFYEFWRHGMSPGRALREAQLEMFRGSADAGPGTLPLSHPFHWAGFVYYGMS